MKKSLSLIMAIAMALCVSGCGENNSTPATTTAAPAATTTAAPQTEAATTTAAPQTEAQQTEADTAVVDAEPVTMSVTDVDYFDETTGYAYTVTTTCGNAYIIVETYASADGVTLTGLNRIYVPVGVTTLEAILVLENGENFASHFEECDFNGVKAWTFTEEAAAKAAGAYADTAFTELYIQMKTAALVASGMSQEEAVAKVDESLKAAGFLLAGDDVG